MNSEVYGWRASEGAGTELEVRHLSKRYGNLHALDQLSLKVEPGCFHALLGPSGSGKTSLLMAIAGFLAPDRGEILVNGRDVVPLPPEKRNFGMVFQGYALFPHLSIVDNISFALRARGIGKAERRRRAGHAVDLVRLSGLEDRFPHQLSGGQQQRVALARAIAFRPDLLLLDEPLSALDRSLRAELQKELKALQQTTGLTCIYVTHDQDEALSMADTVAVLAAGQIKQIGSPLDLYERPVSRFVASFLGASNFLELDVIDREGDLLLARRGDIVVRHLGGKRSAGPVSLMLRPEKISITPIAAANHNAIRSRVLGVNYLGNAIDLLVDAGPLGRITVRAPASDIDKAVVGREIDLAWRYHATVEVGSDA